MKRILILTFPLIFSVLVQAQNAAPIWHTADSCHLALKAKAESLSEHAASPAVQILWYPATPVMVKGHVVLAIGDEVWGGMNYRTLDPLPVRERAAQGRRRGGRGFVRITLNLSPEEAQNLLAWLKAHENQSSYRFCSGGVCKALRASTSVNVPEYLALWPSLMASYLLNKQHRGPVTKVEWVGPMRADGFLSLKSLGFVSPVVELASQHLLVYYSTEVLQHLVQMLSASSLP